eukprot:2265538-Amphidinium_carterae.1
MGTIFSPSMAVLTYLKPPPTMGRQGSGRNLLKTSKAKAREFGLTESGFYVPVRSPLAAGEGVQFAVKDSMS